MKDLRLFFGGVDGWVTRGLDPCIDNIDVPIDSKISGAETLASGQINRHSKSATLVGLLKKTPPSIYSRLVCLSLSGLKYPGAADEARALDML